MKCMVKSLPLQRWDLASRAIKQLKDQIIITDLTLADTTMCNSTHLIYLLFKNTMKERDKGEWKSG